MHRDVLFAFFAAVFISAFVTPAFADNRVALVIGNSAYVRVPRLPNPVHDAEDVAAALKRSGFEIIVATDLDKAGMDEAMIKFARERAPPTWRCSTTPGTHCSSEGSITLCRWMPS